MSSKANQDDCRSAPKNVCVTSRCLAVILSPTKTQFVQADGPGSAGSAGATGIYSNSSNTNTATTTATPSFTSSSAWNSPTRSPRQPLSILQVPHHHNHHHNHNHHHQHNHHHGLRGGSHSNHNNNSSSNNHPQGGGGGGGGGAGANRDGASKHETTASSVAEGSSGAVGSNTTAIAAGSTDTSVVPSISYSGGREIWEDFRFRNKTCYWNPALAESIKNLEYMGFVQPCTLLVSGPDLHLDNLRMAWGRRVLKAPTNFSIDNIGDVNGIEMQIIPQTQFIPLPEALCLIIMDLNNNRIVATLDTVQEKLEQCYKEMEIPSEELIYATLANLIQEGKVFHTGSGYFVVTPDTYRVPLGENSFAVPWSPYKQFYIPMVPPPKAQVRSISCQTSSSANDIKKASSKTKPQRSQSARASRNRYRKSAHEHIRRSASLKFKSDKTLGSTKDINLKNSNINQDKNKGEKTTLFSKLFGRYKKKASPNKEVEYATFSAQFPPPEWQWYQQQLEKQRRTEEWISDQQVTKSNTWHYLYTVQDTNVVGKSGLATGPTSSKLKSATVPPIVTLPPYSCEPMCSEQASPKETAHYNSKLGKEQELQANVNRWSVVVDEPNSFEKQPPDGTKHHSQQSPCYEGLANEASSKHRSNQHHKCPRKSTSKTSSLRTNNAACEHGHDAAQQKISKQRKRLERYSYCEDYYGNDISIEYKGKLPNKYSMYAYSRDSGVNCIGLSSGFAEDMKVDLSQTTHSKQEIEPSRISKKVHRAYKKRSGMKHHRHHSRKNVRSNLYDSNENCAVDIPTATIAEEFPETCSYLDSSQLFDNSYHHHHHHHHHHNSLTGSGRDSTETGQKLAAGESSEQSFNTVIPNSGTHHDCPMENLVHETRELNLRDNNHSLCTRSHHAAVPLDTGQHRRQKKRHSMHVSSNRSASAENARDSWQLGPGDTLDPHILNNQQIACHKPDTSHSNNSRPRSYVARSSQLNSNKDLTADGNTRQSSSRGHFDDDFQVVGVV
ncbi:uncharacterized protein LOC115224440 isoform X2 [Octopus sinensis]|uniref:Uncharacterized protein LOC115224440 isoform X2 n=1 Tax=Octopus sinensis TaxID=2607531 RepID=A0A6P7TIC5_9MOLL|nr:uncharacterized protein LOC115224440 isoform X2 [Octopus sinensis]